MPKVRISFLGQSVCRAHTSFEEQKYMYIVQNVITPKTAKRNLGEHIFPPVKYWWCMYRNNLFNNIFQLHNEKIELALYLPWTNAKWCSLRYIIIIILYGHMLLHECTSQLYKTCYCHFILGNMGRILIMSIVCMLALPFIIRTCLFI